VNDSEKPPKEKENSQKGLKIEGLFLASIFCLLLISFMLYLHFPGWSENEIPIQEPWLQTIAPESVFKANFNYTFVGDEIPVEIILCPYLEDCIPCPNCTIDIFYDFGDGRELYQSNISLDENSSFNLIVKTEPTFLYVNVKNAGIGWLRIPKETPKQWIYEGLTGKTYIATIIKTWIGFLSAVSSLISGLILIIKYLRKKLKRKPKPDYIG